LRPVFVERKPRDERNLWIHEALTKSTNADLALETLQLWVLGKNERLVCDFLDALAIKHDGKGLIDELPAEPDAKKVSAAVEAILAKYSPEDVWIYLHLFAGMDTPWPHLKGLLMTYPAFAPEALAA